MATEEEKVGTYNEFREQVLPRIKNNGYNAIQVMAIQEHPTTDRLVITFPFLCSFFRFGTPDELASTHRYGSRHGNCRYYGI